MVIGRGRRREHPNQHFVLLLRKNPRENGHAHSIFSVMAVAGQSLFWSRDWRHFRWKGPTRPDIAQLRLRMHRTYFRTGLWSRHFRARGHVTSGCSTASLHRKCDFVRPHILLMLYINIQLLRCFDDTKSIIVFFTIDFKDRTLSRNYINVREIWRGK